MTSARKRFANRANARKSTGPKTAAGKARVSRNALRHGFAREGWAEHGSQDVAGAPEVAALARAIAGGQASAARIERAFAVAAAQHDLIMVRHAKRELAALGGCGRAASDRATSAGQVRAVIYGALLPQIARLDRYERRVLARRRRAVAAFDASAAREGPAGGLAEQSQRVKSQ